EAVVEDHDRVVGDRSADEDGHGRRVLPGSDRGPDYTQRTAATGGSGVRRARVQPCAASASRSFAAISSRASRGGFLTGQASAMPSPSQRGSTWMWKWNTVCAPAFSLACNRVTPSQPKACLAAR